MFMSFWCLSNCFFIYWSDSLNYGFLPFAASVVKAVLRYGKKQFTVDETRRDTYRNPVPVGNEPPVVTAFEDNFKQLLSVRNFLFFFYFHFLSTGCVNLGVTDSHL